MDFENRKERTMRIIKSLMFNFGFSSVSSFANHIGSNYMQIYYPFTAKVNELSPDVVEKILNAFPTVRREYVETGEGEIETTTGNKPTITNNASPVNAEDIMKLFDRITTLLEKVHAREEMLDRRYEELKRIEENLLNINYGREK